MQVVRLTLRARSPVAEGPRAKPRVLNSPRELRRQKNRASLVSPTLLQLAVLHLIRVILITAGQQRSPLTLLQAPKSQLTIWRRRQL